MSANEAGGVPDGGTPATSRQRRSPRSKRVSGIREVARLAGVSLGTVSNVVNHPDKVSEDTRQHVEAVIARLDFVPNRGAADLRRGRSRMIGLVLPDITNPFFAVVARGVIDAAAEHGYIAVLCNSDGNSGKEHSNLELLHEQRVAGVLLTPVGKVPDQLDRFRSRHGGIVLVDRAASADEFCSVSVDDVTGGQIAASHLIDRGADRFILVNGPSSVRQCADRRRGARRAVRNAGLPREALSEIVMPTMTVADGVRAGAKIIASGLLPPAIFCTNDLLAIGVQRELTAAGVEVPTQVAVVGYDDIDRAHDLPIPLTSVRQPKYELGYRAGELLIAEVENTADHRHERVVFDPVLIARSSSP